MGINSENIYAALFTTVGGVTSWASKQRRLRRPDDLKGVNYPAVFQVQESDMYTPDLEAKKFGTKALSESILHASLLVFVHAGGGNEWPTTLMNPIIDSLKTTFGVKNVPPGATEYNTLGGLVQYALVSGKIEYFENAKSSSVLAIVPIKILAFA